MSSSITLLGDSIFDNAVYVPGEPCVADQLQELMPTDVGVQLLAVDGDSVKQVKTQLEQVPRGATHLFVSVGFGLSCQGQNSRKQQTKGEEDFSHDDRYNRKLSR